VRQWIRELKGNPLDPGPLSDLIRGGATALATVRAERDEWRIACESAREDAAQLEARVEALERQLEKYMDPSRWP